MNESGRCGKCGGRLGVDGRCSGCLLAVGLEQEESFGVEELHALLPDFDVLERVGSGGMGVVYRARQRSLDRDVAIKILAPNVADSADFVDRFQREAKALATLTHPNIVAVYDYGMTDGVAYIVMEWIDGTSLRKVMEAGELASDQALKIVSTLCDTLQYAHDQSVVHRDIKPENILLTRAGEIKVVDFGLARSLNGDPDRTMTAQAMGTPAYMAPEQLEQPTTVDHRADIFSLGVMFYEMLTGELPMGRFAPPSEKVQIDVRLDDVVLRTLEKERERRYQRAADVKTDIHAVGKGKSATPAPGDKPKRRTPAYHLVTVIGCIGALLFGAMLLSSCAAIAIPNLLNRVEQGKGKRTVYDLNEISVAVDQMRQESGSYPVIDNFDQLLDLKPDLPPVDGWANPFIAYSDGERFVVGSKAASENDGLTFERIPGAHPEFDTSIIFINGEKIQWQGLPPGSNARNLRAVGATLTLFWLAGFLFFAIFAYRRMNR